MTWFSERAVAAQNAADYAGNAAIARTSVVITGIVPWASAVATRIGIVIHRGSAPASSVSSTSIAACNAAASGMSADGVSADGMSAATAASGAMAARMTGSPGVCREGHATERDRADESNKCFMKHFVLL